MIITTFLALLLPPELSLDQASFNPSPAFVNPGGAAYESIYVLYWSNVLFVLVRFLLSVAPALNQTKPILVSLSPLSLSIFI